MNTVGECLELLNDSETFTLVSLFDTSLDREVLTFILYDKEEGRWIGQRSFNSVTRFDGADDFLTELWGSEWLLSLTD